MIQLGLKCSRGRRIKTPDLVSRRRGHAITGIDPLIEGAGTVFQLLQGTVCGGRRAFVAFLFAVSIFFNRVSMTLPDSPVMTLSALIWAPVLTLPKWVH